MGKDPGRRKLRGEILSVETYGELTSYVEAFRNGHFDLLVVVGSWGLGKSRLVKEVLGKEARWIEGTSTAFGIYTSLHASRDRPIVIDDVDSIYSDKHCVSLLKAICSTEPKKRVQWNASASYLGREGLPTEFTTSSRVLIICNEWRTLNQNVAALEDRGLVVRFVPGPKEVHARAAAWFKDAEIYEWFEGQLPRIEVHSFRYYVKAAQMKAGGLPWKRVLPGHRGRASRAALARSLMDDESFAGNEERAVAFTKRGGGSRVTFYNYRKKIAAGEL